MATLAAVSGIRAGFSWDIQKETNTGSSSSNSGSFSYAKSFASSTSASPPVNTATKFHVDQFTILASGTKSIDLSGSLLDPFGDANTFTKVRYIYVELVVDEAAASSGISMDISGTNIFGTYIDAPGAATKFLIQQGGSFQYCVGSGEGHSVTATTADLIKLTNMDAVNSVIVRVGIAGI